jgi:hypothetical protein
MFLLILAIALAFPRCAVSQYTRHFLRGLKTDENEFRRTQYIEVAVNYIKRVVLEEARKGKTYYSEPFYGCDIYGDRFLSSNCEEIIMGVRRGVEEAFPECDLYHDPGSGRYILSWI